MYASLSWPVDSDALRKEGVWGPTGKKGVLGLVKKKGMFGLVKKKGMFVRIEGWMSGKRQLRKRGDMQTSNHAILAYLSEET